MQVRGVGRFLKALGGVLFAAIVEYVVAEILKWQAQLGHNIGWVGQLIASLPFQVWALVGFVVIALLYVFWPTIAKASITEGVAVPTPRPEPSPGIARIRRPASPPMASKPTAGKLTVHVVSSDGTPVDQATVAIVSEENWAAAPEKMTDARGVAEFDAAKGRLYTVLVAHPDFSGEKKEHVQGQAVVLAVSLESQDNVSSLIIARRYGWIPGFQQHRLNPHEGNLGDSYVYIDGMSVNGAAANPVHFTLNQELTLEDHLEPKVRIRFLFIRGETSLINYSLVAPETDIMAEHPGSDTSRLRERAVDLATVDLAILDALDKNRARERRRLKREAWQFIDRVLKLTENYLHDAQEYKRSFEAFNLLVSDQRDKAKYDALWDERLRLIEVAAKITETFEYDMRRTARLMLEDFEREYDMENASLRSLLKKHAGSVEEIMAIRQGFVDMVKEHDA